jgi:hypothetical protein
VAVRIETASVHGPTGEAEEDEDLSASAQLVNDGSEPVSLDLSFRIDGSEVGRTAGALDPGASASFSLPAGRLTAGGHDLTVVVGVDDGSSSSQVEQGVSFTIAPPPPPTVEIGPVHLQPHTNVEHEAGHAWSDEKVGVSVHVHNTGQRPVQAVVVLNLGGHSESHDVHLGPGEDKTVSSDAGPFPAGEHTISASVSTETSSQSVLLGESSATLSVQEPTGGWHPVNVQIILHDFRQRPLEGRAIFVEFTGMDAHKAGGAETVDGTTSSGGILTRPGITIPPKGALKIIAVSTGAADEPIENTIPYHLADGQTDLSITANQESAKAKVTAKSVEGVKDKLSAEMHAGLEIEVVSVDGKVGSEHEESHEFEHEVEWEVLYGRPSFQITIGG